MKEKILMAETPKKPSTRKRTSATASATKEIAPKRQASAKFWAERGRQHGHDAEDWLRAEQQLRGKAS
jgi:hypothetical protein